MQTFINKHILSTQWQVLCTFRLVIRTHQPKSVQKSELAIEYHSFPKKYGLDAISSRMEDPMAMSSPVSAKRLRPVWAPPPNTRPHALPKVKVVAA